MTQKQRKQKLNEKLTNLRVRVAFTSIKSLEREATKLASEFSEYTDELSKELEAQRIRADKAEQESEKWRVEAFRKYPTPEAYELACEAREKHRQRANAAEQLVNTIDEALDEEFKLGEWDDFMNLIHKEITAYREGSNTDAKRD